MRCSECGSEHELLDPAFRRPDMIAAIPAEERPDRVNEGADLCMLRREGGPDRYFVRTLLPVRVDGIADGVSWGVWVEVSRDATLRIRELWNAPDQDEEPPFEGTLANRIPGYTDTLGLPLRVQLTGPKTRPSCRFLDEEPHPFARECNRGVTAHRAAEWLRPFLG